MRCSAITSLAKIIFEYFKCAPCPMPRSILINNIFFFLVFFIFISFIHTYNIRCVIHYSHRSITNLEKLKLRVCSMFLIKSSLHFISFHFVRICWKTHISNKYMISIMMIWHSVIFISGTLSSDFYSVCSVIWLMDECKIFVSQKQIEMSASTQDKCVSYQNETLFFVPLSPLLSRQVQSAKHYRV